MTAIGHRRNGTARRVADMRGKGMPLRQRNLNRFGTNNGGRVRAGDLAPKRVISRELIKGEVAGREMPKLAGEFHCSGLEQINQYALHVTSAHAYALISRYQLQCVGGISVPPLGKITEGINQLK